MNCGIYNLFYPFQHNLSGFRRSSIFQGYHALYTGIPAEVILRERERERERRARLQKSNYISATHNIVYYPLNVCSTDNKL